MPRPDHLPDFNSPPLAEVAMSVQFPVPSHYRNIYAQEVWALFADRFPEVQEQPYIPPSFEVFGGLLQPAFQFNFSAVLPPVRYWFVHPEKAEIIQFQPDRFIHNWRKIGDKQYPRYDQIAESYIKDLEKLASHYSEKSWGEIAPNQCELTYVNHLPLIDPAGRPVPRAFYLKSIDMSLGEQLSEVAIKAQVIMRGTKGEPVGRLSIDATVVADKRGKPLMLLTLIARGAPAEPSISAAYDFLSDARDLIVTTFTQVTSDPAHALWERTK